MPPGVTGVTPMTTFLILVTKKKRGIPGSHTLCSPLTILDPWMFVADEEKLHHRSVFTGGRFEFGFTACCLFPVQCGDVEPQRFNSSEEGHKGHHCKVLTLSSRHLKTQIIIYYRLASQRQLSICYKYQSNITWAFYAWHVSSTRRHLFSNGMRYFMYEICIFLYALI